MDAKATPVAARGACGVGPRAVRVPYGGEAVVVWYYSRDHFRIERKCASPFAADTTGCACMAIARRLSCSDTDFRVRTVSVMDLE